MGRKVPFVIAATCPLCGTTVFSRACADRRKCLCSAIEVRGGPTDPFLRVDRSRLYFNPQFSSLAVGEDVTLERLYVDWSLGTDLFGLIPASGTSGTSITEDRSP